MKQTKDPCGVSNTLKVIGSKWTLLIVRDLCTGTKRFGELQQSLAGISPRTLSARLKQLETDNIVTKKIFAEVPPRVEYSLTAKGHSLESVIDIFRSWGEEKMG